MSTMSSHTDLLLFITVCLSMQEGLGLPLMEQRRSCDRAPLMEQLGSNDGAPLMEQLGSSDGAPLMEQLGSSDGAPLMEQSGSSDGVPPHKMRTKRCACDNRLDFECHYFCHLDIIWINTPSKTTIYGLGSPLARRRRSTGRCACANPNDRTCASFCFDSSESPSPKSTTRRAHSNVLEVLRALAERLRGLPQWEDVSQAHRLNER